MGSLKMSSLKSHFFWSFLNSISSIFIKIGTLVFVSWLISPEVFGVYSIGIAIVLIVSTLVQLGMPTSLTTLAENENLTGLALILGVLGCLLVAFIFYILIFFSTYEINDLLVYFTVLTFFQIILNILEASCKRDLKFRIIAKSEIISAFLGSGLITIVLALMGYQIYSLILGQMVYCIIKIIFLYANISNIFVNQRISKRNLKILMSNSGYITLAELSNIAMIQIQRPIIGMQINTGAAGIWSRVYQIIIIQLSVVVQPIDYMALPLLAKMKEDKGYLEEVVLSLLQVVSLITLTCASFTVFLAPLLIPILLGPKWVDLIIPLQIGALIVFFRAIERVLLSVSRAIGVMKLRAAIQFIQLLIVIVFLFMFSGNGLIKASWALISALMLGFLISLYTTNLTIGISTKKFFKCISPGVIIFLLSSLIFFAIQNISNADYWLSLLVSLFIIFLLLLVMIWKKEYFFEAIVIEVFLKILYSLKSKLKSAF